MNAPSPSTSRHRDIWIEMISSRLVSNHQLGSPGRLTIIHTRVEFDKIFGGRSDKK